MTDETPGPTARPSTRPAAKAQPVWRRTYDLFDSTINRPIVAIVGSDTFADALAMAARSRRACLRLIERRTRRTLHLLNLPAATDVRRLEEQLLAIQRQLASRLEPGQLGGDESPGKRRK